MVVVTRLRGFFVVSLFVLIPLAATPDPVRTQEGVTPVNASEDPVLRPFVWRSIGPIGQGGRVDDLAVHPNDPHTYFVGFATAGLWKTTNNGTTFKPVFDEEAVASVGDIAIAPSDPNVVWVGTGEVNNRQSSSFGRGIYRSEDGGETFELKGLEQTQSISRVIAHPSDPDIAWVAANGHLFGPNPERGVFKTTDGGNTWFKVLYVDEDTGATDLVVDPSDPDRLFAAMYERRRTPCCFVGGGPGSGIWQSGDGGDTWARLSGNGLPAGTMGRIALSVTPADPSVVYAQIEVAADQAEPLSDEEQEEWQRLAGGDSLPLDPEWAGVWRSTDGGATWDFRSNENGRPMYFSQIRADPVDPEIVYTVDQRVRRSEDGGRTWTLLEGYGHVDQHALWINPENNKHILLGNDGSVDVTYDQGETWESLRSWAVGQPYHASVDMRRPYYVCTGLQDNGSWCGPSSVRSGPILSEDWYRVGGGDGFYTAVDPTDHGIVYSESQNGNLRRASLWTGEQVSIRPRTQGRFGQANIVPDPPEDTEIRWHWNTPMMLSPHNPDVVYAGGNRLFRSYDRGTTWTMSEDLTKNVDRDRVSVLGMENSLPRCRQWTRGVECILSRNDGVSMYSTIISISESPLVPGVLWVGTDDGNVQLSRDGGVTWNEVGRNVGRPISEDSDQAPVASQEVGTREYYVSRVEASHFDASTAYISLDGHRSDDLRPYVYVTRDSGRSWQDLSAGLPEYGNVNTIREDPRNPDLLYVGTEFGFYVSRDRGTTWQPFMTGLPTTRIDDVLVHPRDNDLVLATHGRSIYVMDDITALQDLDSEVASGGDHLFEPRDAVRWKQDRRLSRSVTGDKVWQGENAPAGPAIHYYLPNGASGAVTLTIEDVETGEVFRDLDATAERGLNRVQWNLRGNPPERPQGGGGFGGFGGTQGPWAEPGVYRVALTVGGTTHYTTVRVLEDVWLDER